MRRREREFMEGMEEEPGKKPRGRPWPGEGCLRRNCESRRGNPEGEKRKWM